MRVNTLCLLAGLLFVTAIMVVKVRHEHRLAYVDLQAQKQRHDSLVDEWGQLLTEVNLYASQPRIEKDARARLNMKKPSAEETIYLDLADPREPDAHSLALREVQ